MFIWHNSQYFKIRHYKQHLAPKIVKFNKRRHKKSQCITKGIVKSISHRDKLYKQYRTTPTNTDACDRIKINSNTYDKILKPNIRMAKQTHYYLLFKKYKFNKYNIKNTWTNIKDLLQQSKVKRDFRIILRSMGKKSLIQTSWLINFVNISPTLDLTSPKT